MTRLVLLAQLGTTLPLVGLIWMVQLVAYPLFARAGASAFPGYHALHSTQITLIVGPLMLGELVAAVAFLAVREPSVPAWAPWAGIALVALAWGVTALLSVPQHAILARGFDARAHAMLVTTNWLRTFAWTARGALLLWLTARAMR